MGNSKGTWFATIKSIVADGGFVVIKTYGDKGIGDQTISVDEAVDRAEALRGLSFENEITHRQVDDIREALMVAALAAKQQQEDLKAKGTFVDFAIKLGNVRELEILKATGKMNKAPVTPQKTQKTFRPPGIV